MKSPPLANRSGYDDGRTAVRARRCDRKDRGLRRLMSRTKEGRDALRSSEAHPQARSIAPPWPDRRQGRVPIGRHRPKSAETGETHPLPGADLRAVRRRGAPLLRWQPPLTHIVLALRQGSSTKSVGTGRSAVSRLVRFPSTMIAAIRATALAPTPGGPVRRRRLCRIICFAKTGSSAIVPKVRTRKSRN